jgi:hypothetical protein
MAESSKRPIAPSDGRRRRTAKPKEPERDFDPPPPCDVVWLVVDRADGTNRTTAVAQTAFRAHELSGIKGREGRRLAYGECDVAYSENATQARWLEALLAFFEKVFAPRSKPNGKMNGRSNGKVL